MTANAREFVLSISLAESLNYASGYSVEPYEFINILEKFGGCYHHYHLLVLDYLLKDDQSSIRKSIMDV